VYQQSQLTELLPEINKELARSFLIDFTEYTYKDYGTMWFHKYIASRLDNLLTDDNAKNLIINLPPQHGKSELTSRRFPAFALGRNPDLKITVCAYSADLASTINRQCQRIMETEEYTALFPGTRLNGKNIVTNAKGAYLRNSDIFEIVGRKGFFNSVGIGGPLSGKTVDIGIIDDPIKDYAEAKSEVIRTSIWEWYNTVFKTRLHNKSKQLIIMTRWHEDDLVGKILSDCEEAANWEQISIPALKDTYDTKGIDAREYDEALWPDRHSKQKLLDARRIAPMRFEALYQQHPSAQEGIIFKEETFQYYSATSLPKTFDKMLISVDSSFKDKSTSDPVSIGVWGLSGANAYLLDSCKGLFDFVKTIQKFIMMVNKYPLAKIKLIEDKSNGTAIIQVLKKKIAGIIAINPTESKEARAEAVSVYFEAGNVYFPEATMYPWVNEFLTEIKQFPNGAHDDQVDMMTQALNYLYINIKVLPGIFSVDVNGNDGEEW